MNATVEQLARPEILTLSPYVTAEQVTATIRLNANEAPLYPLAGTRNGLNRYPAIRPTSVQTRLAELLGVPDDCLLATRGSTEAIDMLMRAFCRAYTDNIVVSPPAFAMYRVYADVQGADVVEAPLQGPDFTLVPQDVLDACTGNSKLVFVCSPNNPTGATVPADDILALVAGRKSCSLVVVDEAYIEFSDRPSLAHAVGQHDNLVVLRTLSKAWGLAGARCGAVVAAPAVIGILSRILPPYSFSTPATDAVLTALANKHAEKNRALVTGIVAERSRLSARLNELPCVQHVWPSDSNFLLVRFADLAATISRLRRDGILIRDFSNTPALNNCARITVGSGDENDRLLAALKQTETAS